MRQSDVSFLPIVVIGGEHMVRQELWYEIHSRYRLKESKKSIAR